MMRSLYGREGMSCAPMRAALLNAFFLPFADRTGRQLLGVRLKRQAVRTPCNERQVSRRRRCSQVILAAMNFHLFESSTCRRNLPTENRCRGCSDEKSIPGWLPSTPLDRRLCSHEESARRAPLAVDVESSNNVAVQHARVAEGHVRRGDNGRRDRIAWTRLISSIRETDIW